MGKFLTNQMVQYLLIKNDYQMVQNASQKDHPNYHGHVKINLFKMMG